MSETDDLKDNIIYKLIILNDLKDTYNWKEV